MGRPACILPSHRLYLLLTAGPFYMQQNTEFVRKIEIDEAIVGMRRDRIVHVYFKPHTEINVELQTKLLGVYNEITGTRKHFFIFEGGEFCTVTNEARENAMRIEDIAPVFASVVVVKNVAQKLIADFYQKVNKPKQPYRVVWQFEKGIKWLSELKKEAVY